MLDETKTALDYVLALKPAVSSGPVLTPASLLASPPSPLWHKRRSPQAALTNYSAAPSSACASDPPSARAQDFLERRLQTQVFKLGLAKSIHHARVLIRQRHIRVGKQIVNIPSFMVRTDSQKHIDFSITSPYGGGRPGRNKRKAIAAKGGGGGGGDDDEDME